MRSLDLGQLTRRWMHPFSLAFIILAASTVLVTPAKADYGISIVQGTASVDIKGDFDQGIPMRSPINETSLFAQTPVFHSTIQGANASALEAALSDALKAKAASASETGVKFTADSNGTLLNYELSFTLANLSTEANGQRKVDLSWRSFAIVQDFGTNGISINKVVPNYLQTTIVADSQATGGPGGIQEVRTWYLNNAIVSPNEISSRTESLLLFDFSSLSQPLGQWSIQRDFSNSRVVLQAQTGFNLTFVLRITEAGETDTIADNAVNNLSVKITAPLPVQINDDNLVFDEGQSAWIPQLMVVAVLIALAVFIGTFLVERRLQPSQGSRQRRTQR
jgi:hypothetical protein